MMSKQNDGFERSGGRKNNHGAQQPKCFIAAEYTEVSSRLMIGAVLSGFQGNFPGRYTPDAPIFFQTVFVIGTNIMQRKRHVFFSFIR